MMGRIRRREIEEKVARRGDEQIHMKKEVNMMMNIRNKKERMWREKKMKIVDLSIE